MRDRDLLERARVEAFRCVEDGGRRTRRAARFLEKGGWERRFGLARVG